MTHQDDQKGMSHSCVKELTAFLDDHRTPTDLEASNGALAKYLIQCLWAFETATQPIRREHGTFSVFSQSSQLENKHV